jgi:hypothetical protein
VEIGPHPDALPINALDREALDGSGEMVRDIEADPGARAPIFTSGEVEAGDEGRPSCRSEAS